MKKLSLTLILLISLVVLPLYGFAQNSASAESYGGRSKSLLASLYCATIGAWLASPRCIEENNTILPASIPDTVVNQIYNSTTTQSNNASINSTPISKQTTSSNFYTNSDINSIVNSAVQKALSSYSSNSNNINPNDFVTRDFLSRQIGAMGDSTGRTVSSVSSSITSSGTLTSPTLTTATLTSPSISGATITGSSFSGTTGTFTGNVGIGIANPEVMLDIAGSFRTSITDSNLPVKLTSLNDSVRYTGLGLFVQGDYLYSANYWPNSFFTIDIKNPESPQIVGRLNNTDYVNGLVVSGKYAFMSSANGGVKVVNIANPTSPTLINTISTLGLIPTTPVIQGRYLYVLASGGASVSKLLVVDIADPSAPVNLSSVTVGVDSSHGLGNTFLSVIGKYAYAINQNDNSVSIIDISDPLSLSIVSTIAVGTTPNSLVVSGRYMYVANKGSNNISVVDISNPAIPAVVSTHTVGSQPSTINISGKYLYVGNLADKTLSVIDVSNPASPVTLGTISSAGQPYAIYISGRYLYLGNSTGSTNGLSGIDVYDISGIESNAANIFSLSVNQLQVKDNSIIQGQLSVAGGVNISEGLSVWGNSGIKGSLSISSNTGIGTTSPYAMLSISNTNTATTTLALRPIASQTANILDIYSTTGSLTSVLTANQNLGLGTSSPYAKLSVAGSGVFTDNVTSSYFTATSTTATSTFAGGLNVAGSSGLTVLQNGNVGVGTDSPITQFNLFKSGSAPTLRLSTNLDSTGNAMANIDFYRTVASTDHQTIAKITATQNGVSATGGGDLIFYSKRNGYVLGESMRLAGYNLSVQGNLSVGGTSALAAGFINTFSSNSSASVYGTYGTLTNSGNGGSKHLYLKTNNSGSGTATNVYGIYLDTLTVTNGSVTNNYGLYLGNGNAGTETNYGIYQADSINNYFAGNVGIGTTSPYAKLSVVGQVVGEYFTATSTTASSTIASALGIGVVIPELSLHTSGAARINRSGAFPTDAWTSNAGYIPENFVNGLDLAGDLRTTGKMYVTATNEGDSSVKYVLIKPTGQIIQRASGSGATTNIRYMSVNNNQGGIVRDVWNYYIGASEYDSTSLSSGGYVEYGIRGNTNDAFWGVGIAQAGGYNAATVLRIDSNGDMGVGTTSPYAKLSITNIGTDPTFLAEDSASPDTTPFIIDASGNVGIGTTSPYAKLSVVGTVAVSGLTANSGSNYAVCINNTTKELTADVGGACNPSSERFKNNIEPLSVSATDIINSLKPSSFAYNDTTGTRYGLIAEQVSSIDPHLATYEEDGITPHGLDTSAIISVLVKAVQEMIAKINSFADIFRTKELCIGETCVTEIQLKELLNKNNIASVQTSLQSSSTNESTTIVSETPTPTPTPTSVQTSTSTPATIIFVSPSPETSTTTASTETVSENSPTPAPDPMLTPTPTLTPSLTPTPTQTITTTAEEVIPETSTIVTPEAVPVVESAKDPVIIPITESQISP